MLVFLISMGWGISMRGVRFNAFLVIVLGWVPVLAQAEFTELTVEQRIAQQWQTYLEAKRDGQDESRKLAFENLRDLAKGDKGVIHEEAALLFLREGNEDLVIGKFADARQEFLNSAQLNPYLWPAYAGLARIKLDVDNDYVYYVSLNLKGMRYAFNPQNTYFIMDFLVWFFERLLLAFKWALIAAVGIFLVKYGRPVYATTAAFFDHSDMSDVMQFAAVIAILLAPCVLGLNWLLAALFYWVLVFPFMIRREKQASLCLVIGYGASLLLMFALNNLTNSRSSPETEFQLAQFFQGDPITRVSQLEDRKANGESSNGLYFALANAYYRSGDSDNALENYNKIEPGSSYGPLATVNKGNIFLYNHEYQKAIDSYEQALNRIPTSSVALYNMSVAKSRIGDHREAETFLRKAKRYDPQLIEDLYLRGDSDSNTVEIDFNATRTLQTALVGSGLDGFKGWIKRPVPMAHGLAILLGILAAFLHNRSRNPRFLGKSCSKCGKIYYIPESASHAWCSQCVNLYVRKDDLPSESKMKKYDEVQRHNRIKRKIVNLVQFFFPGAKSIFGGSPWLGIMIVWIWICLLVFSLSPLKNIGYSFLAYMNDFMVFHAFIWATTVFFWLLFGFRGIWREE